MCIMVGLYTHQNDNRERVKSTEYIYVYMMKYLPTLELQFHYIMLIVCTTCQFQCTERICIVIYGMFIVHIHSVQIKYEADNYVF